MKQTARIISTYAADTSGVCSALYELGGMTVIHDASGCNSTYNTHDEPRWYDQDSLVFISALSEVEAMLGDDGKLLADICATVEQLRPAFVAIAGSPIPLLIGADLAALAAAVEKRCQLPAFGLASTGMHSYLYGAGLAFAALAERLVEPLPPGADRRGVNILGLTPLDFSVNGSAAAIRAWLTENGWPVISAWAMGDTLANLRQAAQAQVNLVVSQSGLLAARVLQRRFGTPYVVGVPLGQRFPRLLLARLSQAADSGQPLYPCGERGGSGPAALTLIGESVYQGSLAAALALDWGLSARVLCPLESEAGLLAAGDAPAPDEDRLLPLLSAADRVIADPLYQPILPPGCGFIPLASEAFSGRIYRARIPNLIQTDLKQSGLEI